MMKLEELVRYWLDLGQGGQPYFIQRNKDMRECSGQKKKSYILPELGQAEIGDHAKDFKREMVRSCGLSDNLGMESEGKEGVYCDSKILIWKTECMVVPFIEIGNPERITNCVRDRRNPVLTI